MPKFIEKIGYVIRNSFIFANANSESDPVFPKFWIRIRILDSYPTTEPQNATFSIIKILTQFFFGTLKTFLSC